MKIAERALEWVHADSAIGLGSGRAASAFVRALGERVRAGLKVRGIPTSEATAELARQVGIPLTTLDDEAVVHVTVDGADEVDPQLNLIKGYGGALVREKIVASASLQLIILVGAEKLVEALGSRGRLPVEVVPFGLTACRRRLLALGIPSTTRPADGGLYVTDNGNHVLDCRVGPIRDPAALEQTVRAIPGVVGTGLFVGMAHTVLVQDGDSVSVKQR